MKFAQAFLDGWQRGQRSLADVDNSQSIVIPAINGARDYVGMSQSGRCGRQVSFSSMGYEGKKPTTNQLHQLRDGYLLEADSISILKDGGICVLDNGKEVWGNDPCADVKGHIDGLAQFCWDDEMESFETSQFEVNPKIGDIVLFEHKTFRQYPFQKLLGAASKYKGAELKNVDLALGDWGVVLTPGTVQHNNPEYYMQIQTYMLALNSMNIPTEVAVLFGRSREQNMIAVEEIPYDATAGNASYQKLLGIAKAAGDGKVMGPDYDPVAGKDWNCNYCDYKEQCTQMGPGVAIHTTQELAI